MNKKKSPSQEAQYQLDDKGCFVIENYNESKPFSNFFPGIAGLWGIPMWAFYVNRGQCIASCGIEAKNNAIMEFQPANKSYRITALQGFRTFIKVSSGKGDPVYWEPFQRHLTGTNFDTKQTMSMTAHDLTLTEVNHDLGLTVKVNYFTLPDEPYAGLVRHLTVENTGTVQRDIELVDGLPLIVPFGLTDELNKFIARTVEAWVKVRNIENKAPYFQLNVEVSDKPRVTPIAEGNFFFSFDPDASGDKLLQPIVEASRVFGEAHDFIAPLNFLKDDFSLPDKQLTDNRTPAAMSYGRFTVAPKAKKDIFSVLGFARSVEQLNAVVDNIVAGDFLANKAQRNKEIIDDIKSFALTHSSSPEFDKYCGHTFLDNILRGGLPVSLKTNDGHVAFNVYSRKHGDLERDYNYFFVAATYYSQGNGNYRDVNQNRRNDVWFNGDVGDNHMISFLNLVQADGYNPLVVKGTAFSVEDQEKCKSILQTYFGEEDQPKLKEFLTKTFLPGDLLLFISENDFSVQGSVKEFLSRILEVCRKQELADHGEGFWSDHWKYNMDMVISYFTLYPENLKSLLLEKKPFYFYHNDHYVLPRDQRYMLTDHGVRQYKSVACASKEKSDENNGHMLKTRNGEGAVYYTHLACKLLCLIANKISSLDPSGVGVEMEADKPNWCDSLNGLPGLMGSAISETLEVKRFSVFLLESLKQLSCEDNEEILVFEELATFVSGLNHILSLEADPQAYWNKANDVKERYRQCVRQGIDGAEKAMKVTEIKNFLSLVIDRVNKAVDQAKADNGLMATYFYHDITEYQSLDKTNQDAGVYVRPTQFKKHALPLFLEGYVHALRVETNHDKAKELYRQVRDSHLFDKKLKMYKLNADLNSETDEIGRMRIFPRGWLENESIWMHMEYKFMLEILRSELYEEFYENFRHVFVPFLNPETYGRSVLENSSFIVSSANDDAALHGRGFVARLSGSTAEFVHMWLMMNVGKNPFTLSPEKKLVLNFQPALAAWLFTNKAVGDLPENTYAFKFLGHILVVYHNPNRKDTFGPNKAEVREIQLHYADRKKPVVFSSPSIPAPYAEDVRSKKIARVDVFFE